MKLIHNIDVDSTVTKPIMQESILSVAKPMESAIVQGSQALFPYMKKDYNALLPLQFVHFSDIHSVLDQWNRIASFMNYYKDYISFALHTGDYCGSSIDQYSDLYNWGVPTHQPILNCVGNHDKVSRTRKPVSKETVHGLLFNDKQDWGVTFLDIPFSMTYYKDFPASHIRLIVLDNYFDPEAQQAWLKTVLAEAKALEYHVITATHPPTDAIADYVDTAFNSLTLVTGTAPDTFIKSPFEDPIADFKEAGGVHICHLCGHLHYDLFGYTARGILNIAVEMATAWAPCDDARREIDTNSYDCFNVTSIDVNQGLLRLVRIGNNYDLYLRRKSTLCYDYINRRIISFS